MTVFKCILAGLVIATAAAATPTTRVDLGSAEDFAIIAKTGITAVPQSPITGDVGVSPISGRSMTGFDLKMHSSNTYATSDQIDGKAYAADYTSPTPKKMIQAISDMETAYTDAAGRPVDAANKDIKAGLISGTTFTAGVYKWGTDVMFSSDITIEGTSSDIFIFQTTGNVVAGSGARVMLKNTGLTGDAIVDGPKASNIFWQVAGQIDAGTTSHLEGVLLVKTTAVFKTGSSLNGRVLAQTACTLDKATITQPSQI